MNDLCRVTTYRTTALGVATPVRKKIWRKVRGIKSLENGQLFQGFILHNHHSMKVYRHVEDTAWTSYKEEATGAMYERIKPQGRAK